MLRRQEGDSDTFSVIDRNSIFDGTFQTTRDLQVEGEVKGTIDCKGTLFVASGAVVGAKVEAENVTVAGDLNGEVRCRGRLQIMPTGKVRGKIVTQTLVINEGAFYEGQLEMAPPESRTPVASPRARSNLRSKSHRSQSRRPPAAPPPMSRAAAPSFAAWVDPRRHGSGRTKTKQNEPPKRANSHVHIARFRRSGLSTDRRVSSWARQAPCYTPATVGNLVKSGDSLVGEIETRLTLRPRSRPIHSETCDSIKPLPMQEHRRRVGCALPALHTCIAILGTRMSDLRGEGSAPTPGRRTRSWDSGAPTGQERTVSYESEERYWTDYLRVALPVIGLLLMLALFWWWAQQFIGDDKERQSGRPGSYPDHRNRHQGGAHRYRNPGSRRPADPGRRPHRRRTLRQAGQQRRSGRKHASSTIPASNGQNCEFKKGDYVVVTRGRRWPAPPD